MKKIALLVLVFVLTMTISAQQLSDDMQKVYDACMSLREAISAGNTSGLRAANKELKECNVNPFTSLRYIDDNPLSLDGHFVFDEVFIDSLIEGRDVYKFAQRYADVRGVRGASSKGKIYTKTCVVGKSSSTKLSFKSREHQEIAVITEPGRKGQELEGRITLRIHDVTHDKWYNDTKNVKKGMTSRTFIFDLPTSGITELELEIKNCGKKDISFVVISN